MSRIAKGERRLTPAPDPTTRPGAGGSELERLRAREESLRAENDYLVETQRYLEAERDRYSGLYQNVPMACVALDDVGAIRELNRAAATLLGIARDRAVGKPLRLFLVEEDRRELNRHLTRCRITDGPVSTEVRLTRPDGPPAEIELCTRGLLVAGALWATVMVDIEARRQLVAERERLVASEGSARAEVAARDQFIAMLSHELRTPLMPILATVSALKRRSPSATELNTMLEMIHRNAVAEARLVDDLLDATRIQRGKMRIDPEITSVHAVVHETVNTLDAEAASKQLIVHLDLAAERFHASADPLRLEQVFWNLLRNAIKFTPARGRIDVRSWNHDAVVAVEVSDTGQGLSPAGLERLFIPFEQAVDQGHTGSGGGLGLGLAIAKGIVDLHGGRLFAASRGPGTGSRFIVELETVRPIGEVAATALPPPAAAAATAPEPPPVAANASASTPKLRILLVEDHPDTGTMMCELLTMDGYEVQLAPTASAALQADLSAIDLVLSDLGLPDMGGHELMRALQTRRPLPAIALSGYGTEADRRASKEAGFLDHLVKPVQWEDLVEAIKRACAASG